jgi:hypothetical protein
MLSSIGTGLVIAALTFAFQFAPWICAVSSAVAASFQWTAWHKGGWARRREERFHAL